MLHILQIFQISGISQCIYVNNPYFIVVSAEHILDIIRPDKSGSACH